MVFHDSVKAYRNMKYALPRSIEHIIGLGLGFATIQADITATADMTCRPVALRVMHERNRRMWIPEESDGTEIY